MSFCFFCCLNLCSLCHAVCARQCVAGCLVPSNALIVSAHCTCSCRLTSAVWFIFLLFFLAVISDLIGFLDHVNFSVEVCRACLWCSSWGAHLREVVAKGPAFIAEFPRVRSAWSFHGLFRIWCWVSWSYNPASEGHALIARGQINRLRFPASSARGNLSLEPFPGFKILQVTFRSLGGYPDRGLIDLIDFLRKRIARRRIEASLGRHLGSAPAPS